MIPDISGTVEYKNYNQTVNQIKQFSNYSILGKDSSGMYDLYLIELGKVGNPALLVTCSLHGTEWQGTQYTMEFMKMIESDTYPDQELRDKIVNDYHVLFMPMVNPWGVDKTTAEEPISRNIGRRNSNDIDLNRDFDSFITSEARLTKYVMDKYPIFAYLDCHMIIGDEPRIILGHGQTATTYIRDEWLEELEEYIGYETTAWSSSVGKGLSRRYMRDKENPYTDYTLSYITELSRPEIKDGELKAPLTNEEIFKIGMANLFMFFKTSLQYIDGHEFVGVGNHVYKIEYEHKTVYLKRDFEGLLTYYREEYDETCNNMIIETELIRDINGNLVELIRNKK